MTKGKFKNWINFEKKCKNCGYSTLHRQANFCKTCGYPTPKRLREVEDPDQLIKTTLRNEHTLHHRVKFYGLITVMQEMGYMTKEEADELTQKGKECLNACLDLKQELDKFDQSEQ